MPVVTTLGRRTDRRYAGQRVIATVAGGALLLQFGGCVEGFVPAAVAIAEQFLLVRFAPLLPLF